MKFHNSALNRYLELVEETEPPRIMHVWACISAAGAAAARHVWFDLHIGNIYPNQFIFLVGPPGCRKNTAISLATGLLEQTDVRYAPDDTGGQRQGLLAALINEESSEAAFERTADDFGLFGDKPVEVNLAPDQPITVDAHCLYIKAPEIGTFLGQNNLDLARFLIKMWDGDDYVYMLKTSVSEVRKPLCSLIGGTTPTDLSIILPAEAMGQGFMSRVVLVYAPKKYQQIARPRMPDAGLRKRFVETYRWISKTAAGKMEESREAHTALNHAYYNRKSIVDTRFIHYIERRHTHLIKLATCLALLRRSMRISEEDVEDAVDLLEQTERTMPEALGQYGLSPESIARQRMLDFLRTTAQPVSKQVLWTLMIRDMKMVDFNAALAHFVHSGQLIESDVPRLGKCYAYKEKLNLASVRELIAGDT